MLLVFLSAGRSVATIIQHSSLSIWLIFIHYLRNYLPEIQESSELRGPVQ